MSGRIGEAVLRSREMAGERRVTAVNGGNGGISGVSMERMIKCDEFAVVVVEEGFFFVGEVEEVVDDEIVAAGFGCSVVQIRGFHSGVLFFGSLFGVKRETIERERERERAIERARVVLLERFLLFVYF